MSNYKQTDIIGSKYTRSHAISIQNGYNKIPVIDFFEQEIITIDDDTIIRDCGRVSETLEDPATIFEIVNPVSGETTGISATYQEVYTIMHSLYIHLATKRDNDA